MLARMALRFEASPRVEETGERPRDSPAAKLVHNRQAGLRAYELADALQARRHRLPTRGASELAAQWHEDADFNSITVAGAAPAWFAERERTGFPCT